MIPSAVTYPTSALLVLAYIQLSLTHCHSYPKLSCFLLQLLVATPARLIDILSNHGTPSLQHMFDTLHLSSSLHSCKLSGQSTVTAPTPTTLCTVTTPVTHHPVHRHHSCHPPSCSSSPLLSPTTLCTVTTPVTHHPVHRHHSCHPPSCSSSPLLSPTTLCTVTTPVTHHPAHRHHSCHPPPCSPSPLLSPTTLAGGAVDLTGVKYLVLDEVDSLLQMGFEQQARRGGDSP